MKFQFEGRQVSAAQLKRQGVDYSEGVIQSALESGAQTMAALVIFCERRLAANVQRGHRAGYAAQRRVHG